MSGYFLNKGSEKIELEGETLIGRSDECDLKVDEGHPSRRHATLTIADDGAWLEDLESANGTYVNELRITTRTKLNTGDRIAFDTATFEFEAPAPLMDEGDATVVRRIPIDHGATVVRPIPTPPEPAPPPPAPAPEAVASEAVASEAVAPEAVAPEAAAPAPTPPTPAREPEPPAPEPPAPPPEPTPTPEPPKAVEPEPAPPPPAPEPAPAPAPAAAEPIAAKAPEAVPRSWADPEYQNEEGTRMFTPAELKAMTEGVGEASATDTGIEGAHLQVTKGANTGTTLMFGDDKNEWTVGTDADRDLCVSDSGVSAFHAKITREGQRWKVIDQMSANGTFVNEQRGTVSFLSSGDRVRFGPVECTVLIPAGGKSKSSTRKAGKARNAKKGGSNTWIIAALAAAGTIALMVIVLQFV